MGMYTEIFFRAELVSDVPPQVIDCLRTMTDFYTEAPQELPDHPLFKTSHWEYLGATGSSYFPLTAKAILEQDSYDGRWRVFMLSNLKNYSGEIGKFFDWIDPYTHGMEGTFLGYSLYEESEEPKLFHKQKSSEYFKYDKDVYNMWRAKANLKPVTY